MRKFLAGFAVSLISLLAVPSLALAHVIVTPSTAGIGQELIFNVSVPNERDSPVSSVRVAIPKGVQEVTPTIVPGFAITTTGNGDDSSAITWTGQIPVGQRADFSFGAQMPASATQLNWKAYQTYTDGTVVHWDQKPAGSDDATGNAGPYSITKVSNDLSQPAASTKTDDNKTDTTASIALALSIVALVASLSQAWLKKKH